jgi:predicted transcriptional regulator
MGARHAFVMMIEEKWWEAFCRRHQQGKQVHAYVKGGLAPPKETSQILFYVTKPIGEIAGYAEFIERKVGDASELWKECGQDSVLSSNKEYAEFIGHQENVSFIRFKNLHLASHPILLNNVLLLLGAKRLGRKGFYVDKETSEKLISIME